MTCLNVRRGKNSLEMKMDKDGIMRPITSLTLNFNLHFKEFTKK